MSRKCNNRIKPFAALTFYDLPIDPTRNPMLNFSKASNKFAMITVALTLSTLSACGGTSNSSNSSETPNSTDSSVLSSQNANEELSVGQLSKLICDANPTRMGAEAEQYTKESWQCNHKGESVRIDIYESDKQEAEANQVVLDFYEASGDKKALSELPLVCGSTWALGVDFDETRDSLITLLVANGLEASTCN